MGAVGDIDMTVEQDLYYMIEAKGDVQPLEGQKYQRKYQILEGENNLGEYLERLDMYLSSRTATQAGRLFPACM